MYISILLEVKNVIPEDELYEEDIGISGVYEYKKHLVDASPYALDETPFWKVYDDVLDVFHSENAIAQLDAFEFIGQAIIHSELGDHHITLQSPTDWLIQLEQSQGPARNTVIESFLEQNIRPFDQISWLRELIQGAFDLAAWLEVEWSRRSLWMESWIHQAPVAFEELWNQHANDKDRLDVLQSKLHVHIKEKLWSMLNISNRNHLLDHPDSLTCLMHDCPYLPEIKTHPRLENIAHQINTIKTLLNTNELNKDVLALVVHQPQTSNGPSDFDFSLED